MKFIISTDNCTDYMKSFMIKQGIYFLPLKRIVGDKELAEFYDSEQDFNKLYEDIKKGVMGSTSQINPDEFIEHFKKILEKEKEGDIIHVSLSSGLSGTHNSAVMAAEELNPTLKGRKIYAFDSLTVSGGMQILIDKLMELRHNTESQTALSIIEKMRDNLHVYFMVDDLFHLKRGGRVSAAKAIIGSMLGIKPVLCINKQGKLDVIDKIKGIKNASEYFANKPKEHGHTDSTIFLERTSESELYQTFKNNAIAKYPYAKFKEAILGPIIGTHVGCGALGIIFVGSPSQEVK